MLRGPTSASSLLVVALSGCDMLFQLDHIPDGGLSGTESVVPDDDAVIDPPGICMAPLLDDIFANQMPCDGWGNDFSSAGATVAEINGLVIQPIVQSGSRGGCGSTGLVPITGGIIVEVPEVITGARGEFTLLALTNGTDLSIGATNEKLTFMNNMGTVKYVELAYLAQSMRWWRLRADGVTITAEYSADGKTWSLLGIRPATQTTSYFQLFAGLNANQSMFGGRAVYKRLIICP